MFYCKHCNYSLVDFEIEEMCERKSDPICWECAKKNKKCYAEDLATYKEYCKSQYEAGLSPSSFLTWLKHELKLKTEE